MRPQSTVRTPPARARADGYLSAAVVGNLVGAGEARVEELDAEETTVLSGNAGRVLLHAGE